MDRNLVDGVHASASNADVVRVRKGYDVYRVLVHIYSDIPTKDALIKNYYVWMTEEFASDSLHQTAKLGDHEYVMAALQELSGRYFGNSNEVPPENGLDCSNERGVIPINDAEHDVHPVEQEHAIKTSIGARVDGDRLRNPN